MREVDAFRAQRGHSAPPNQPTSVSRGGMIASSGPIEAPPKRTRESACKTVGSPFHLAGTTFEADPRRRRGFSLIQKPIPAPIPTRYTMSRASTRTKNRRPTGQSSAPRPGTRSCGACSLRTAASCAPRSPPVTATPPARWSRAPSRPLACSAGSPRARANGPSQPRPGRTPGSTPDPRRGNAGTPGRWSRRHRRWSGPPRAAGASAATQRCCAVSD